MTAYHPDHPQGLPIGDGWLTVAETDSVRFPYDDSVVAQAPVGDADLARRAIDAAVSVREAMAGSPPTSGATC